MRKRALPLRRSILLTLAALACLGLVGTWSAPAASAHSRLVSSDPDDGASLPAGPQTVTLTFNEGIQSAYAVLNVVGPDDHFWQSGDPNVDGSKVSVGVRELGPTGNYTINYRVTSADGHVISGQRSFELTVAGNGEPGPLADASADQSDDGIPVWYFIVGAVVVLVVGLGIVFWLTRRPKTRS
ncbi:copper resistance protein CopC [Gordonia sp. Swx-4]|uniref:copper resistance CopC family protein n=1 Tax=Gordonia sp. Swx-4 TaxID=3029399 RepID=UPI0025742DAB|nr:copper resistance CopC family protein [Gordonia sp. Swx-4]WJG14440.1 copper resistance protein CopC [Gordonia sp. Swx-4]